jgi:MtaA/CmuA family methyltransferase
VLEGLGEDVFIVGCFDQQPFSLACALMGINELMMALVDDRPLVEGLLERCRDHCTAYAVALAEAGVNMLSTGDSPAVLIGPKRYRELALPSSTEVFRRIREEVDIPVSLHICGDATPILNDMVGSGADVLEVDHLVDLKEAVRIVGNRVVLWGNIDSVGVLERGTPESVAAACGAAMDAAEECRYVLSSGCTLSVGTPEANLKAMFSVCRNRQAGVSK